MSTEQRPSGTTDTGWPVLNPSRTEPCDGINPMTERPCVLGYHDGYHRDTSGAEWLDD